jgi:hypothetical protein
MADDLVRCTLRLNKPSDLEAGATPRHGNGWALFADSIGRPAKPVELPLSGSAQTNHDLSVEWLPSVHSTIYQDPLGISRFLPGSVGSTDEARRRECSRMGIKPTADVAGSRKAALQNSTKGPARDSATENAVGSSETRLNSDLSEVSTFTNPDVSDATTKVPSELALVELDNFASEFGFMKASTVARTGNIIFEMLFSPVISPVLEAVVNNMVQQLGPAIDAKEEIAGVKNEIIEVSLSTVMSSRIAANLTAILPDAITWRVSHTLTKSLTVNLGGHLEQSVPRRLLPRLQHVLTQILGKSVPHKLNGVLPDLLARSLTLSLTETLTHTLTHSLVPTLTQALTHTKKQDWYCRQCYLKNEHCRLCHSSSASTYYTNYYSTYYADYYSSYFGKYYADAIKGVDRAQHPQGVFQPFQSGGNPMDGRINGGKFGEVAKLSTDPLKR